MRDTRRRSNRESTPLVVRVIVRAEVSVRPEHRIRVGVGGIAEARTRAEFRVRVCAHLRVYVDLVDVVVHELLACRGNSGAI
jgi:hypothetical protein